MRVRVRRERYEEGEQGLEFTHHYQRKRTTQLSKNARVRYQVFKLRD